MMMYLVNEVADLAFFTFLITHAFQDPDTKDLGRLKTGSGGTHMTFFPVLRRGHDFFCPVLRRGHDFFWLVTR